MLDAVLLWIDKNQKRWLGDLNHFLAIPSVSAQPAHDGDMRRAAEWAADYLKTIGMDARVVDTPRHPAVLATTPDALCDNSAPHVLVYGHYDVQPPEPLDLWESAPFKPTVRDGKLFARGASDDKGQVHCHLAALTAWQEINHGFPCRVTLLLEGEEEIGSPNFMGVVQANAELLKTARVVVISDSTLFAPGVPAITYGLRGLVYFQMWIKGASSDLHSGMYGGAVANPAHALVEVLGSLHDKGGRVTVPGFYDAVLAVTAEEQQQWASLPFKDADFADEVGVRQLYGEAGQSTMARRWARPTLEINGLTSGYQGPGAKTVLPAEASAKFSCRLVPDQDPKDIARKVEAYVRKLLHERYGDAVTVAIEEIGAGSPPALTPVDSPAMAAARDALEIGFGKRPLITREGGSIPVVTWLKQALGLDTIMVGFGLPTDHIHAPNEKLDLDNYYNGIRTLAALYDKLAEHLKN